jgi:hypothetical protein
MVVLFIVLVVIGFASTQTGWVALALLCVWPLLFGVGAWSLRGLRDNYQLTPKQGQRTANRRAQEVLN